MKKQSILINDNKLLIKDKKFEAIIIKAKDDNNLIKEIHSDDKILHLNFNNKLKQAEENLMKKIKEVMNRRTAMNEPIYKSENSPQYKILSLSTSISIAKERTFGEVKEKVTYELSHGSFSSIIRKFSLSGSSDSFVAFKLFSNDIKLKEARIINNCLEEVTNSIVSESHSLSESEASHHPYVCVIAIFEEINANHKNHVINIEYEYVALNLLRLTNHYKNSIVWYYDNYKRIQPIDYIKFSINIENPKINALSKKDVINYPEKMTLNLSPGNSLFNWEIPTIKENEYQKISIDIPIFNHNCKQFVIYYLIL
jgi:hypothetical protein